MLDDSSARPRTPSSRLISRRAWLRGLGATLGWCALARDAAAATGKVLLIGDSMIAGAVGVALQRRLQDELGLKVVRRGKTSSGLARPDFYDWQVEGPKAVAAAEPAVVVTMFGGNDGQGLWMGKTAPSPWIRWGDPEWTPEYARRIEQLAAALTERGAGLVWIGMPIVEPSRLRARVAHMNTLYRAAMTGRPGRIFVDIWDVLADEEGRYVERMEVDGVRTRIRASDGVHVALPGAELIARRVSPAIEQLAQLGERGHHAPGG